MTTPRAAQHSPAELDALAAGLRPSWDELFGDAPADVGRVVQARAAQASAALSADKPVRERAPVSSQKRRPSRAEPADGAEPSIALPTTRSPLGKIAIGAVALLVVVGLVFVLTRGPDETTEPTPPAPTAEVEAEEPAPAPTTEPAAPEPTPSEGESTPPEPAAPDPGVPESKPPAPATPAQPAPKPAAPHPAPAPKPKGGGIVREVPF
jgi:cytoskeletal protein RodZ